MKLNRRRYIIDKDFQIRFIIPFVVIVIIGSIIATLGFNHIAVKRLEALIWTAHITAKATDEIIGPLFVYVNIANFIFGSFMLILAGVWMMRKISGALHRMAKDIMKATTGELSTEIILRQKDEFHDTAAAINNIITGLRGRFSRIKRSYAEVSMDIKDIERTYMKGESINEKTRELLGKLNGIREKIDK